MTYAIVARDPIAGEIGGAVQTHFFNAGAVVLWPEAGTGMVATMAMAETAYGRLGLRLLRQGQSADATLAQLLARDSKSALRQVAILGVRGAAGRAHGRELYRGGRPSLACRCRGARQHAHAPRDLGSHDRGVRVGPRVPGFASLDGTGSGRAGRRRHPRSTIRGDRRRQDRRGSRLRARSVPMRSCRKWTCGSMIMSSRSSSCGASSPATSSTRSCSLC